MCVSVWCVHRNWGIQSFTIFLSSSLFVCCTWIYALIGPTQFHFLALSLLLFLFETLRVYWNSSHFIENGCHHKRIDFCRFVELIKKGILRRLHYTLHRLLRTTQCTLRLFLPFVAWLFVWLWCFYFVCRSRLCACSCMHVCVWNTFINIFMTFFHSFLATRFCSLWLYNWVFVVKQMISERFTTPNSRTFSPLNWIIMSF